MLSLNPASACSFCDADGLLVLLPDCDELFCEDCAEHFEMKAAQQQALYDKLASVKIRIQLILEHESLTDADKKLWLRDWLEKQVLEL